MRRSGHGRYRSCGGREQRPAGDVAIATELVRRLEHCTDSARLRVTEMPRGNILDSLP